MPTQDYYQTLGVSADASEEDIKRAYRGLARRYHPDVVRDGDKATAEAQFKKINEAYSVLSDAGKRAQYDRYGTMDGQFSSGFDSGPGQGVGDIFDLFFGGGLGASAQRSGPAPGSDLRYDLEVDLLDVLNGSERAVSFQYLGTCENCKGSGAADGRRPSSCADCHGTGQLRTSRRTPLGQFMTTVPCVRCGGSGSTIANPCKVCKGKGRVEQERRVAVKIPAGVEQGTRLRYSGMGEAGERGGRSGDLYVVISVRPHEVFERAGSDLSCQTGVTFTQAALGAKLELEGLDGPATLELPAGTQNGATLRINGRGLPRLRGGGRGDLIVDVEVLVPKKLTRKQRELLEAFAQAGGDDKEPKGWFRRR